MNHASFTSVLIISTVLLSSCANTAQEKIIKSNPPIADNKMTLENEAIVTRIDGGITPQARDEIIERGTGRFINENQERIPSATENTNVIDLDFDKSPISDFIRVVLGDLLSLNFIIDPSISGTVTLHTSTALAEQSLLPLVEQVLDMNGIEMVLINGFYQIQTVSSSKAGTISPSTSSTINQAGQTIQIIPLEYISAQEMKKLLSPVVTNIDTITFDETRNLIIATGNANEIKSIRDTIEIFDVDWLQGMSLGLFPLDHVQPETLSLELGAILNSSTDESQKLLEGLVRLVPLERLRSMLVVSSTPSALNEVETWIRRLDQPSQSSDKKLFVYHAQNSKATELADILSRIIDATSSSPNTNRENTTRTNTSLAPGLSPVDISNANAASNTADPNVTRTSSNTSGSFLSNIEDVKIIADDVRNSLVILASDEDYAMIESAILELDVIPLQVLIEASIIEVTLRDDLSYGVEWFFKNSVNASEFNGIGTTDLGSSGISALAPGFSYTVIDSADQVRLALNTLAAESEVNVLSAPSLMVLDNKTAMINVGDEIPVPTRQSISNIDPTSPTVNEITFRQTGITLTVTPRVNSSGLVTMEISQEVSSAATTTTSNLDAPTIQNRQIKSVVAILSGETIMLGGLMLEQKATSESGLPILNKIPILGNLFSQNTNESSRKELLVLITPKVVKNKLDARAITDEYRSKLKMLPPIEPSQQVPGV